MARSIVLPVAILTLAGGVYAAGAALTPAPIQEAVVQSGILIEKTQTGGCAAFAAVSSVVRAVRKPGNLPTADQAAVRAAYRSPLCLQDALEKKQLTAYLKGDNVCDCSHASAHVGELLQYFAVPVFVRGPGDPGTLEVLKQSLESEWPPVFRFADGSLALATGLSLAGDAVDLALVDPDGISEASQAWWAGTAAGDGALGADLKMGANERKVDQIILVAPCVRLKTSNWGNVVFQTDKDAIDVIALPEINSLLRSLAPYVRFDETLSVLGEYPDSEGASYLLARTSASPEGAEKALSARLDAGSSSSDDPVYFVLDSDTRRFASPTANMDVLDNRSLREFANSVGQLPNLMTPDIVGMLALIWGYESITSLGGFINMVAAALSADEKSKLFIPALEQALVLDDGDKLEVPKEVEDILTVVEWGDTNAFEMLESSFLSERMRATALIRWHPEDKPELMKIVRDARNGEKFAGKFAAGVEVLSKLNDLAGFVSACQEGMSAWNVAQGVAEELAVAKKYVFDEAVNKAIQSSILHVSTYKSDIVAALQECGVNLAPEIIKTAVESKLLSAMGLAGIALGVLMAVESIVLNSAEIEPVARLAFAAGTMENMLHQAAFETVAPKVKGGQTSFADYRDFKALVHLSLLLESVGYANTAAVLRSAANAPISDSKKKEQYLEAEAPALALSQQSREQARQFLLPDAVVTASVSASQRMWATGITPHEECLALCTTPMVSGTILDEQGEPLAGAFAGLWLGDHLVKEVEADSDKGSFGFCNVGDGAYSVRAAAPGYCAQSLDISVSNGKQSPGSLQFKLPKADMQAQDFYEQMANGQIRAEITGGGQSAGYGQFPVTVQMTNLSCQDLKVLLDAGLTLKNNTPGRQNVVVGRDTEIALRAGERSGSIPVGVYCISRHLGPPQGTRFTPDPTLAKPEYKSVLVNARAWGLDRSNPHQVQNAIWHFSDNEGISPNTPEARLVAAAVPHRPPVFTTRVTPRGAAWSVMAFLFFGFPLHWVCRRWFKTLT